MNAITLTAELIGQLAKADLAVPTATLMRSTRRMAALLDSVVEYNRAGLGAGMQIQRTPIDLASECSEEIELLRAAHPGAAIELAAEGDTRCELDASRIREALAHLVTNAVKHGVPAEPVIVKMESVNEAVRLTVENATDRQIPASEMEPLFEPLRRGAIQARAQSVRIWAWDFLSSGRLPRCMAERSREILPSKECSSR